MLDSGSDNGGDGRFGAFAVINEICWIKKDLFAIIFEGDKKGKTYKTSYFSIINLTERTELTRLSEIYGMLSFATNYNQEVEMLIIRHENEV